MIGCSFLRHPFRKADKTASLSNVERHMRSTTRHGTLALEPRQPMNTQRLDGIAGHVVASLCFRGVIARGLLSALVIVVLVILFLL